MVQGRLGYFGTMKLLPSLLIALAAPAVGQETAPAESLQDCSAHKFETVVERIVDGEPQQSRVKLCGKTGQSDADWIGTLEDAIAKLRANDEMPAETRSKIIAALHAEIARLMNPSAASATTGAPPLTPRAAPRPRDFRDDYTKLPALPPPVTSVPVAPPPVVTGQAPTAGATPVAAAPASVTPAATAPSLDFICYVPGDMAGPAPCLDFQRDTLITIRAKSDVPAGTQLHFARNGDDRAKIEIGPLKRGRSVRVPFPIAVCAGVGDGRLTIAVWNGARPARTEGPFPLRCA
jgi:hypothetical protein